MGRADPMLVRNEVPRLGLCSAGNSAFLWASTHQPCSAMRSSLARVLRTTSSEPSMRHLHKRRCALGRAASPPWADPKGARVAA
jgi:hypothetical protein